MKKTLLFVITIIFALHAHAQSTPASEMLDYGDELMTAAMSKLFDQNTSIDTQRYQWSEKYTRGNDKGNGNTTIWPQGFGLAALAQMALAEQEGERYEVYKTAVTRLAARFPNYETTINNVKGYSVYGGSQHRFLDDNAWAALGLLDAYEMDQRKSWLDGAKMVATYMVTAGRLLENNPPGGGGMYWQDSPDDDTNTYKTKNTANNGPAIVIFCRLYELTNDETYLDYAKMTYQWLYNTLLDKSSWLMWDALNVKTYELNKYIAPYTTASMLHAASILYKITGESKYKRTADRIAEAAYRRWFENYYSEALGQSIKLVKTENNTHSDDIVVLMRAFEAYARISSNHRYLTAFAQSLRHIWKTRRDAETGLMNYDWKGTNSQDEWTTLGQTGYVEMYARMARLEAEGLVPSSESAVPAVIEAENTTKSSGVTTDNDTRCSGGKRVGYVGSGRTLTFTYNAGQEGLYEFTSYYMTASQRTMEVTVNGTDKYSFACPSTSSWDGSNIGNISIDVKLKAGSNTIVVGNASGDAPNLDKFEITYVGQPEPEPEPEPETIIAKAEAKSPDGSLAVLLECNSAGEVFYSVSRGGTPLLNRSRLGFTGRTKFTGGIGEPIVAEINDPYDQLHGKTSHSDNHFTQLQAELLGATTAENLTVEFRIYDKGVAFRYVMDSGNLKVFSGELTEFNFAGFKQALALGYSNDYTWYYNMHPWSELNNARGYNEPVLVQTGIDDTYVLLTEAAHYGETAGNAIMQGDEEGILRLQLMVPEGKLTTSTIKYPFSTPWRTLIIGSTKDIVESTIINDLNPETEMDDLSWIRPGRVSWNWAGEDRQNTGDINVAKRYADLAAYLGWEYVLIDEGWKGNFTLEEFVPYAKEKGVDVIVWYHNNDFSSVYNTCLRQMRAIADTGVKGLKIDFFDGDQQSVIKKYETLLRAAAECNLMVDFHGCTRPTGWERTYPHLMTMEGVLGGEFLLDQPHMNQADHASNLVVTRNVLGSMDFTPTKLAQRTGSLKTSSDTSNPYTTWSYQLALWTLFESGFQCLIDCPDNIIDSPIVPVLQQVPTSWDETRCLEAEPTQYATLARRSGEDWYVATVSKTQRMARVKLDFLDPDKEYTAYIYRDGNCSFDITYQKRTVTAATTLSLSVKPNGGATVIISTDADRPYFQTVSYEETTGAGGTRVASGHCSGGYYKNISENASLKFPRINADADGEYAMTIYYMLPEEESHAYIQVGDEGDKMYYDFHVRDDYDRSKGLVMGMKTIYVQLKEGLNTVYYGCDNGIAPALDKITVTPAKSTQDTGISQLNGTSSALGETLELTGDDVIVCSTIDGGVLSLFDTSGRCRQKVQVEAGETRVKVATRGVLIASLNMGRRSIARKFIIK